MWFMLEQTLVSITRIVGAGFSLGFTFVCFYGSFMLTVLDRSVLITPRCPMLCWTNLCQQVISAVSYLAWNQFGSFG
jgi:hypothetical protein